MREIHLSRIFKKIERRRNAALTKIHLCFMMLHTIHFSVYSSICFCLFDNNPSAFFLLIFLLILILFLLIYPIIISPLQLVHVISMTFSTTFLFSFKLLSPEYKHTICIRVTTCNLFEIDIHKTSSTIHQLKFAHRHLTAILSNTHQIETLPIIP